MMKILHTYDLKQPEKGLSLNAKHQLLFFCIDLKTIFLI